MRIFATITAVLLFLFLLTSAPAFSHRAAAPAGISRTTPSISSDAARGYPVPTETNTVLIGQTTCSCNTARRSVKLRELLG